MSRWVRSMNKLLRLLGWREIKYPICRSCPECGCGEYITVEPVNETPYMRDRVCQDCKTRYIVPTPKASAFAFLSLGLFGSLFGVSFLWQEFDLFSAIAGFGMTLGGIQFAMFAAQSLFETRVKPPDYQPPDVPAAPFAANAPPPEGSDNPYQSPRS